MQAGKNTFGVLKDNLWEVSCSTFLNRPLRRTLQQLEEN